MNFDDLNFDNSEDDEFINMIFDLAESIHWLVSKGYVEIKNKNGKEYLVLTQAGLNYSVNETLKANGRFDMRVK